MFRTRCWSGALLVVLGVGTVAAQQPELVRVRADRANVRVAPSIDSMVTRVLSKGTVLTAVGHDSGWVKVELAELQLKGWIARNLVEPVTAAGAAPVAAATKAASMQESSASAPATSTAASATRAEPPPPPPPAPLSSTRPGAANASPTSNLPPMAAATAAASTDDRMHVQLIAGWLRTTGAGSDASGNAVHGIRGAVGFVVPVASGVGIMPELGVNRYTRTTTDNSFGVESTSSLVEYDAVASFLVRPRFGSESASFFIVAGPTITYDVHCNASTSGDGFSFSGSCTGSGSDRLDYGITGGAGAQLGPLVLQVRYTFGLHNFDSDFGGSLRTRTLLLSGGLIL
ncbi:MAG TPA: SH3 domain-containing protein [Gemmatimonadales bacterium]